MKFVHLTHRKAIPLIRKHGVRAGNGEFGRNVFAMPLMQLPDPPWPAAYDQGVGDATRTSAALWKFWARHEFRGNPRDYAAVVFATTPVHWPAELRIHNGGCVADLVLSTAGVPEDWRVAARRHLLEEREYILRLTMVDTQALGRAMQMLTRDSDAGTWNSMDHIEVAFGTPIAPRHIVRIVPCYRTSKALHSKAGRGTNPEE